MYGKSENRAITVVGVVVVRVAVVVRIPDIGAARTHPKTSTSSESMNTPVYFLLICFLQFVQPFHIGASYTG